MIKSSEYIRNFPRQDFARQKPFVIAEAGVNHEGSMDTAKRLIDEAAAGGAHAIKFQSYKADTLASKHSPAYWDTTQEPTESQYELFKKHDSFWKKEFVALKSYCDQVGIEFLSTPFDIESATFLNDLMASFKISSSDLSNRPFIEYICRFGKPILLSVGASYMWEVEQASAWIKAHDLPFCLLHCILNYPTKDENANLGMILHLKEKYPEAVIGYSDHTLPGAMDILHTAFLLGASVIEKHFTHDKSLPGNDHYHAMDQHDLQKFTAKIEDTFRILGSFQKTVLESEEISRQNARRSLVAERHIPAGEVVALDMLTWKRPAFGISPRDIAEVVGKKARVDIQKDDILYWDLLELSS